MARNGFPLSCILVAENEPADGSGMKLACERAGIAEHVFRVTDLTHATHYLAGWEAYGDRRLYPLPTLLLVDWQVAAGSGAKIVRWVRTNPFYYHLLVVVVWGGASDIDRSEANDLRINAFIKRPDSFRELMGALQVLTRFWNLNNCVEELPQVRAGSAASPPRDRA